MVEISDSMLSGAIVLVGFLSTFIYFYISRRDKKTSESRTVTRDLGDDERDKLELARKVKKELADEAEKVESIRKDIAKDVKEEMHDFIEQKIKDLRIEREHMISSYEQTINAKFDLTEQASNAKFKASDLLMTNLLDKMVEIAKSSADSMIKINDSIKALEKIFYELSGKVSQQVKELDTKVDKVETK